MILSPLALRRHGVLGINARNANYVQRYNPRHLYPLVDDKFLSKTLARDHGLPAPELLGRVSTEAEANHWQTLIGDRTEFVLKPTGGSGGHGILVICGRRDGGFVKPSGAVLRAEEIRRQLSNIITGLHSLGGHPGDALFEARVHPLRAFADYSAGGVPDIRVIVFQGYPVMAMLRLSTSASDGKANLHQGAVGAGIDLASGRAVRGVCRDRPLAQHPDSGAPLAGLALPGWQNLLQMAARSYEITGLGYLGVDLVIDEHLGPLLLEWNARPGLSIQLANGEGLLPRLRAVEARVRHRRRPEPPADRVAWACGSFARPPQFPAAQEKSPQPGL